MEKNLPKSRAQIQLNVSYGKQIFFLIDKNIFLTFPSETEQEWEREMVCSVLAKPRVPPAQVRGERQESPPSLYRTASLDHSPHHTQGIGKFGGYKSHEWIKYNS